jgi:signal transduction histidine kinase
MNLQRRDLLTRVLSFVGIGITILALAQSNHDFVHPWAFVLTLITIAAWVLRSVTPATWTVFQSVILVIMVAGGAIAAVPTNSISIIPVIAGILFIVSRPTSGRWFTIGIVLLGFVLIAVSGLIAPITGSGLISLEAGVLLAALVGFTRRQARQAEQQARDLAEERLLFREEQARTAVLAERGRIARDIHDVLAHSLGGLVIQLDAVDALLDAGRVAEAQARVQDARRLAASGLGDARRAVDTLRESAEVVVVQPTELRAMLDELVDAHLALGGVGQLAEFGESRSITGEQAEAIRRALQEALSNVRKHAPGQAVTVGLSWLPAAVSLEVSNPVPTGMAASDLASTGGGHGLTGMRERFAALPAGRVQAGVRADARGNDAFVVTVETSTEGKELP